jgi:chain length determinant protein EpsF
MNFTQFLLILSARKWILLGVLCLTVAVTATISLLLPKEYTATTTLVFDTKSKDPFTGQLQPSQLFPGYMATQVDIIQSPAVARRVVDEMKLADSAGTHDQFMSATGGKGTIEQWLSDLLQSKLDVVPSRESSVIDLSFNGTDPQFAALMANAFARSYIETTQELRLEPAKLTAIWFDKQITELRANLDKAQEKLTTYQRENGIVESDEHLDVETRRLGEIAGQLVSAQSSAFDATSRARDSVAMPEVINSPTVQNLKSLVAQSEGKLADLGKRVGVNHPDYQRALAEQNIYRTKLEAELRSASRGVGATAVAARQRSSELGDELANQKKRVIEQKQKREMAALLARDIDNAQRLYDATLQRYGQSRMEAQSVQTDIAVLNPAIAPIKPSKPKVFLNILLAVFMGGLLGVGISFVVELLDRRVRSGQDIAASLGIPVLAVVLKPSRRFSLARRLLARA